MAEVMSSETKIAVMNNDIKHINDTLSRMEGKFDVAITTFVTLDKLKDTQSSIQEDIANVRSDAVAAVEAAQKSADKANNAIESVKNYIVITAIGMFIVMGLAVYGLDKFVIH